MKKFLFTISLLIFSYGYSQSAYTKPYEYRDPARVDMGSTFDAQKTLQNRHNANVGRIQNTIDRIVGQINKSSKSDDENNYWTNIFTERCIKKMPNINYSSDSQTDQLINFLYDCINYQVQNN